MPSNPRKLLHLESIRGLAALSVALYHYKIGGILNNSFTNNSWIMVDFFFVLSGFVIALSYENKIHSFGDLVKFQKRRFFRLYPLHLVMLFVFLGIEIAKYLAAMALSLDANSAAFSTNNFVSFLQNLVLLQNLLNDQLTWNYPSWSISAEFYTYLVFVSLIFAFQKSKPVKFVLFGLIILFAIYKLYGQSMREPQFGFYRCLLSFFLGVFLHELNKTIKAEISPVITLSLVIATIAAICFISRMSDVHLLVFPLLFCGIILSLNHSPQNSLLIRALSQKPIVYLGTISYGIYMIHASVWWVMNQFLRFIFKVQTTTNTEGLTTVDLASPLFATAIQLIGLIAILMLAHLSYTRLERPIIDRFKS